MHHRPITCTIQLQHISKMMGCNVPKFGAGGRANFHARLRPLLLQGLAEMRTWRLSPRPAKKGLLLDDKETPKKSIAMATVIGNTYGIKVATKRPSLRLKGKSGTKHRHIARPKPKPKPKPKELDADSDEENQGREISSFPSSPSFRVFFHDAATETCTHTHNQIGGNHAVDETASIMPKETCVQKKVKRERKKRANIRTVMSGKKREAGVAVKNLLNVKAFCNSPHTSTLAVADTTNSGR